MEFAKQWPEPSSDLDALKECAEVLSRLMRDDVVVGVTSGRVNDEGDIELPLYGCVKRALTHANLRLSM